MSENQSAAGRGPIGRALHYLKNLYVVDYRLIVSIVFLLTFGLIMVYSASSAQYGVSMLRKQIFVAVVGFAGMILVSYIDYHVLIRLSFGLYLISLVSLFLVRVPGLGSTSHGASRWIEIGGFSFQPAELLKPAIIILLAFTLTELGRHVGRPVPTIIYVILPAFLAAGMIYVLTRNLSTALIVLGIAVVLFFVAHPNKRVWYWVIIGLAAIAIFAFLYYELVITKEHAEASNFRAGRILSWLYPEEYPSLSMQSRYALYAIGFGGLLGRGLGNGTVKYYLPEPMNDFIFAVIGEELGLIGCAAIIFLFAYQIWRIMTVAKHARDKTGGLLAAGIGAHVALQVLLNIGVAISLLPNTGISLPYISYGGSALLLQMLEMGIVLNISRQIPGRRIVTQGESGSVRTSEGARKSA